MEDAPPMNAPHRARRRPWLWIGAVLAVLVLAVLGLVALRPTTVTVIPRSQLVLFDGTSRFLAYPAAAATPGQLPFTVEASELTDSEVVQANGVETVRTKASGVITVFNEYSTDSVKLVKNTRFRTPNGLIFRAPADIVVPGRKGTTAGQITVTVIADAEGEQYNVGAVDKFTLPGLASNADMFAKVYARSTTAMSGGFVGERPAVPPGVLESTRSAIRARLEKKAIESLAARSGETVALKGLGRITYESLPPAQESGGMVRITEKARIEIPVFPKTALVATLAAGVSADASDGVELEPSESLTASSTFAPGPLDAQSFDFTLTGGGTLVWMVDAAALAEALAGREEEAFKSIVNNFNAVQEAYARIQPFWKNVFPEDPSDIKIKVGEPAEGGA